jgi:exonuclease III
MEKKNFCNLATWNVRGINYKEHELDSILNESNIKITAITETKKKLKGTTESQNYIIVFSGIDKHPCSSRSNDMVSQINKKSDPPL